MSVDKFGSFSNSTSPRGPRGKQGEQGPPGVQGERGLPGPAGKGFLKTESGDYNIHLKRLKNVQEPQEQEDAATKKYVDETYEQLKEYIQYGSINGFTVVNEDDVKSAITAVLDKTMSLRGAAAAFGILPTTLYYRIKKLKSNKEPQSLKFSSKYSTQQVFTNGEEKMLEKYLIRSSKMNYGLTKIQARVLAFEYATLLQKCPEAWRENQMAGIEWIYGFMKRHSALSIRKPENTSLSRATSFNQKNLEEFHSNYERALGKFNFTADRIFNLDETGVTTVVQAPNVIAQKGQKQVGQSVSAERGQLITMCAIVSAIGNTIPPVFIFPRARFHDTMLNGAPTGSVGYANSPTSGWMTGGLFVKVLEHIQKSTRCTKSDMILLLLDNHESHCTIDAINFSRDHGIVLVNFPPHCTHRLQPLDIAVLGPFKQKLSIAQNDWLLNNPGKTIRIHDLPAIANTAYMAFFTQKNITSGFAKPGIFPFSRSAFTEEDFQCSEVTNRKLPESAEVTNENIEPLSNEADFPAHNMITTPTDIISPEIARPYPKAAPRKTTTGGRKKGKSRILTETPEKNEIEDAYIKRQKSLKKNTNSAFN
ncbi:uncharacterized protein LOC129941699 [Eupeodes corollae]|uniref:uncharacterized protein LOC129941699 n=1 Tax=Eupeodes corollae TaxID=290404 RepID=UPI002490E5B1|nr:uncharacterized protein LOC129941699 [Eupeodes corollae]